MKSKVYVGPSLRRNDAIECARPGGRGQGLADDFYEVPIN